MSPYSGCDFFSFFTVFFSRLFLFVTGQLPFTNLVSDEIQMYVLMFSGISAALVGCFLVLKKMTMLANALSHTVLLGIVGSFLILTLFSTKLIFSLSLPLLILGSLIAACLTTLFVQVCKKWFSLDEGSSIGLVFSFLFAIGISLVTIFAKSAHLGAEVIMGNIDALQVGDIYLSFYTFAASSLLITILYRSFQLLCFDEGFAKSMGLRPGLFYSILLLITAASSICCFRAIGVFLFLVYLTTPAITARLFVKKLRSLLILSSFFSVISSFMSIALSRYLYTSFDLALSTAGIASVLLSLFYPFALLIVKMRQFLLKSNLSKRPNSSILRKERLYPKL